MPNGSSTCPELTQTSCAGAPRSLHCLPQCLRFLEAHEPDLIDVAEVIGVKPEELVAAREELEA